MRFKNPFKKKTLLDKIKDLEAFHPAPVLKPGAKIRLNYSGVEGIYLQDGLIGRLDDWGWHLRFGAVSSELMAIAKAHGAKTGWYCGTKDSTIIG